MASLKELRNRISSVSSTQKITKAMQMVAASKLRRAQENVETARPYSNKLGDILKNLSASFSGKLLSSALNGSLLSAEMRIDENFGFEVPSFVDGVDTNILNPRDTWEDKESYDLQAQKLVKMFSDNFDVFKPYVDIDIIDAAPNLQAAE